MVKKLEQPRSKMGGIIAKMTSKMKGDAVALAGLNLATTLAENYKYVDFCDPKTGKPCLLFEYLFGSRGMLLGRMLKTEAEYGVGKSSLLFALYGMAQRTTQALCLHEESEGAPPPPDYISAMGCDPGDLAIQQPGSIEKCFLKIEEMTQMIREADKTSPLLVGIDSISGFGLDALMGEDEVMDMTQSSGKGAVARALSQWFSERGGVWMTDKQMFMVITAQLKDKIFIGQQAPQDPEKRLGTKAEKPLNFNASYVIRMRASSYRNEDGKDVGELVSMKTTKNKMSPKFREIQVPLVRGYGFDFSAATVDFLRGMGEIKLNDKTVLHLEQKGAWVCLDGKNYHSNKAGKEEVLNLIYSDLDRVMAIREALRIRGFGFKFEACYTPTKEEIEDLEGKDE